MYANPKSMMQFARSLAQNPLGILALFIVLVYAISGLVTGIYGDTLQPSEKEPLIWFMVVFPVVVLMVFAWLVKNHHMKLYGPMDFPDPDGFFRTRTSSEQLRYLEEKAQAVKKERFVEITRPDYERGPQAYGFDKAGNIHTKIVLTETLVFRQLEVEFGEVIQRHVAFGGDYWFDGFFTKNKTDYAVEIKMTGQDEWSDIIDHSVRNIAVFNSHSHSKAPLCLLLVFVTNSLTEKEVRDATLQVQHLMDASPVPVLLRVYDFHSLLNMHGIYLGLRQCA